MGTHNGSEFFNNAAQSATTSDDLGKFAPPNNYRFEPELQPMPPRPIPVELAQGRYGQNQRKIIAILLLIGLFCLILNFLPIVNTLGLYFVPLQYLNWIGIGAILFALGAFVSSKFIRNPYRYVKEGIPLVARVRELVLKPTVIINGQPTSYHFVAVIEYHDPETGQLMIAQKPSNEFSAAVKDQYTTSFRIGDYITAIYLKSNPVQSLRPYGFLDLRKDLGLVKRDTAKEQGLFKTVLQLLGLFGLMSALFWNVYAFSNFSPVELSLSKHLVPFLIGALLLGGNFLGWLFYTQLRSRKELIERNRQAQAIGEAIELAGGKQGWFGTHGIFFSLVLLAGGLLLGGATMLCWCLTANALLDKSSPEYHLVQIEEFKVTTTNFILRDYSIEYHFLDGYAEKSEKKKLLSNPEHINQFQNNIGIAEVYAGWLGWPWVKTIKPANFKPT
ncbi:MAG: hypothetical protein AB1489_18455 [Acidobacteriota bacterium]